jgi:hypothetical protein
MPSLTTLICLSLFSIQGCVILWHFICIDTWNAPLLNDYLLHFIESRYIFSIISSSSWKDYLVSIPTTWGDFDDKNITLMEAHDIRTWVPLTLVDHILGSISISIPILQLQLQLSVII